jgi:chromosome partitioning protein
MEKNKYKVFAVENRKGGCGKTTTCIQMIDYTSKVANLKTLAIDMDPSGSLTKTLVKNLEGRKKSLYKFLVTATEDYTDSPFYKIDENLYFLSSTKELKTINMLTDLDSPEMLRNALEPFMEQFDVIILDGSPEITQLTHNLFAAADAVIVPINPGRFSIEGLADLSNEIQRIRKMYNPDLQIEGFLLTNVKKNTKAEKRIKIMVEQCCDMLDTKQFENTIYNSTDVSEAEYLQKAIREYKPRSAVSKSYQAFCTELFGGQSNE